LPDFVRQGVANFKRYTQSDFATSRTDVHKRRIVAAQARALPDPLWALTVPKWIHKVAEELGGRRQ